MEASFEPSSNSNVTAYGSGLETAVRGRCRADGRPVVLAPARLAPENAKPESQARRRTGATMANHSKERTQAEAQFKQVQKAQPAARPTTERGQATADYVAAGHAVHAKTAQLKELRLAKEAADKAKPTKKRIK
jgi:hypothetical protein